MTNFREYRELRAWFREVHLNDLSVELWGNHGLFQRTEEKVAEPNQKAERTGIKAVHTR